MSSNRWEVVGHEWAVAALRRDMLAGRLRHAYLLTGPDGVGKQTLATAFIQAVLCEGGQGSAAPCGQCRPCRLVAHGNHPDVISIAPIVSGKRIRTEKITIDRIRDLIAQLALKPLEAARRVALITDFEAANDEASNAFLKTLEEPPGGALLIVTALDADLLLPTIVSRCEVLALRPLPTAAVQQALVERWQVPPERASLLASLSGGRLGWAASADEQALELRQQRLDELRALLAAPRTARFAYAEDLAKDRDAVRETLDLWLGWWRDVLLIASSAATPPLNIDQGDFLRQVARETGLATAGRAVEAIQRTLAALARNANARLALEVLLLDLPSL